MLRCRRSVARPPPSTVIALRSTSDAASSTLHHTRHVSVFEKLLTKKRTRLVGQAVLLAPPSYLDTQVNNTDSKQGAAPNNYRVQ